MASYMAYHEARERERAEQDITDEPLPRCDICDGPHEEKRCDEDDDE